MNALDDIQINGQVLSVIFPFSITLPNTVKLSKPSAHELMANITYTVKILGLVNVTRTGSVYYNSDTGELKLKP